MVLLSAIAREFIAFYFRLTISIYHEHSKCLCNVSHAPHRTHTHTQYCLLLVCVWVYVIEFASNTIQYCIFIRSDKNGRELTNQFFWRSRYCYCPTVIPGACIPCDTLLVYAVFRTINCHSGEIYRNIHIYQRQQQQQQQRRRVCAVPHGSHMSAPQCMHAWYSVCFVRDYEEPSL